MFYLWHKKKVKLITRAPFYKGVKRNALVELGDGEMVVVPWRSLRKECSNGVNIPTRGV